MSVGLRQRETALFPVYLWRRANDRNVKLHCPYRQYTNLFIFWFVSLLCPRGTLCLLEQTACCRESVKCDINNCIKSSVIYLTSYFSDCEDDVYIKQSYNESELSMRNGAQSSWLSLSGQRCNVARLLVFAQQKAGLPDTALMIVISPTKLSGAETIWKNIIYYNYDHA